MREWIAQQANRGIDGVYPVGAGKRLLGEFGDIPYPSRGALAIYLTASLLTRLQMMDARAIEAERIIVDRMFGDLIDGQRSLAPSDITQIKFSATFNVISEAEGKHTFESLSRRVHFDSFFLKDNFWLIKFRDAESDEAYEVQPKDLVGIAEERPEV